MNPQDPYRISGTEPPEPRQADEHPNVERRSQKAIILSLCAVFFAACAALFSFLQWKAAERSARTAEDSLKTNVATFKFDERPLLSLVDYKAVKSAEGKHIEFTVTLNNVGKTEAYGITRQLEVYYDHKRMAVALSQQASMPVITGGGNSRLNYTIPVNLSPEQATAVDAGSAALKVVLKVNFQNAFKDQQPETFWCLQYNPLQLDHWSPCTPE